MTDEERIKKVAKLRKDVPKETSRLFSEWWDNTVGNKELLVYNPEVTLHLDQDGSLWREPKEQYCYPVATGSARHQLIRDLAEQLGYHASDTLVKGSHRKFLITLRSEIQKINKLVIRHLKLRHRLIEGKSGRGYQINPKYQIIIH